ncbi:jg25996 [Pararge aegeria aegeria]|uniref:Jg25996 protein n=1 Tax=Pararge aegeria aegeria TaxID=348720 RepID=A0A8S4RN63_9NEOP|nr:jg25996 [Pararge aegeria aegeria]
MGTVASDEEYCRPSDPLVVGNFIGAVRRCLQVLIHFTCGDACVYTHEMEWPQAARFGTQPAAQAAAGVALSDLVSDIFYK